MYRYKRRLQWLLGRAVRAAQAIAFLMFSLVLIHWLDYLVHKAIPY